MAYTWPLNELAVINSALALTGDNQVGALNDGSDEWTCASSAYDTAIAYMSEAHSWAFATQVVTLTASGTPPQDGVWSKAFLIPVGCVHVIWVKATSGGVPDALLYDIAGTASGPAIVCSPKAGAAVTLKYVSNTGTLLDSTSGTPMFVLALKFFVMSGIYRGLHEDVEEAAKMWKQAEETLAAARARYEDQKPKGQDFAWPLDQLGIINASLAITGNRVVQEAYDNSLEWNVASSAYGSAIAYMEESHSWGYMTNVALLTPSPTAPSDTAWDTAFPIPADCVHVIWLKIQQDVEDAPASATQSPLLYDIMGTSTGPVIVCNAQGGPPPPDPPVTPMPVTMKYVSSLFTIAGDGSTVGTPTFVLALKNFVISGIYRGLSKDKQGAEEADKAWAAGERILQMARTRHDQQKPKRQFFNSRITASRRIRRPWPSIGIDGWSGSNTPGIG